MKKIVSMSCIALLVGAVGSLVGADKIAIKPPPMEIGLSEQIIHRDGTVEETSANRVQITSKLKKSILDTLKVDGSEIATITMANGREFYIKFFPEDAPNTVKNFIMLANLDFYDGLTFHRLVPGFIVQGGDPLANGTGGAGYNIKAEFNSQRHLLGTVAMARADNPNSASSQFYICLNAAPGLDKQYTVFGQVIKGMDVVNGIQMGDKIRNIKIESKNYNELLRICEGPMGTTIYIPASLKNIKLPDYPEQALLKKMGGIVKFRLHINNKGEIENIKFLSSDMQFNETYFKSIIKNWIFNPAKIGDVVVDDYINLLIKFEITEDGQKVSCAGTEQALMTGPTKK